MTARATLTRRQLYELVWQTPMNKLAEQYGISSQRLSALCERNAVPVPGHWGCRSDNRGTWS